MGVPLARNDLRGHPVGGADEGVPLPDGLVQLSAHPEVHQLHIGVLRQQHVLALDVAVDDVVAVQLLQSLRFDWLDYKIVMI